MVSPDMVIMYGIMYGIIRACGPDVWPISMVALGMVSPRGHSDTTGGARLGNFSEKI